ncbi:MAG: TonB-dependent receptor [Acidobacteriota bacterium]|nr:TonB-dependent receptor [Acidobacteriota bacterium]
MKSFNLLAALLLLFILGTGLVLAQSDRGTIRGTVTDPSEAVISGAKVVATSLERGDAREVTTNESGIFVIPELKAGLYQLAVEASGFKRTSVENIKVDVQGTQSLEVKLEIGEVTGNVVTVNAEAVSINTDTPVRQTNVDERQVRELPLLTGGETEGRTPLSFIFLDSNVGSAESSGANNSSRFRVSGGQASGTEILIDGASVRRTQNGTFFSETAPSPNAFQEFTISTNSYSAEFGNSSGGVVNFTLKSGTNEFHGEAYDYLRNEKFNAASIADNFACAQARPRPKDCRNRDNRNNYGFNIGGPIYIPNFGEGNPGGFFRSLKDRAFFFFHYEGYRLRTGLNSVVTVPTLRMRTGDFSELLNTADPNVARINGGQPVLIYDPRLPSNSRPAIPGNRLDLYNVIVNGRPLLDPAGLAILQRYPLPTRPGIFQNYDASGIRPTDTNQFTIKTDFVLTDKQRLSVSFSRRDTERLAGASLILPLPFTNQDIWEQGFKSNIARIQHDYNITSTLLNHFNIGYTFFDVTNRNTTDPFNTSSLGLPVNATQNAAFPRVGFPGYGPSDPRNVQNIGSSFFTDQIRDGTLELSDFVTYIRGRNTFKLGADVRFAQFNVRQKIDPGGTFNFRHDQTASNSCGNCGYPIASLITGATEFAFNANNSIDPAFRQLTQGYFIQDDIKVSQKLTLNVGLRYDLPGLRTEAKDRFRGFDPTAANPQAGGRFGALVGAGGQSGLQAEARTLSRDDKSNIGPRLGAAYAFNNKTVIRGGIGLYYAPVLYGTNGGGDINTGTIGYNTTGQLFRPFESPCPCFLSSFPSIPATDPNSQFVGNLGIPILAFGQFGNGFRTGRTLQYTIDVQRELPLRLVASVGYIGHRADRLRSNFGRPNALTLDQLKLGNEILRTNINAVTAQQRAYASSIGVTIPANANAVYPGFGGNVAQAIRPFPQYGRVIDVLESEGESEYNALQIKIDRRFAQGLQFGASYTFSRLITNASEDILGGSPLDGVLQNPYDLEGLKTVSPTHSPHVFVTSFMAELPFGKGKPFLNYGGIVDRIFGGFQVSGIFRIQQGTPLVFSLQSESDGFLDLAGIFGNLRPNLTGQPIAAEQRVADSSSPGRFFILNPAAFAAPPRYNAAPPFLVSGAINPAYAAYYSDPTRFFGNAPLVNTDFRSDRYFTADMSVLKKTRITETVLFEIGAEFFNVFNQVLYLPPDTFLGRQGDGPGGIDRNSNRNFGAEGFLRRHGDAGNRVIQLRARLIF